MKALVVDDDEKNRKLLRDLLNLRNLEVIEAKDGAEAVQKVCADCKLCIVDIRLPDIDGYEVARRIKKKYPAIPLLAYTASVFKDEREHLHHSDLFDGVLLKPMELKQFNELVDRFCN